MSTDRCLTNKCPNTQLQNTSFTKYLHQLSFPLDVIQISKISKEIFDLASSGRLLECGALDITKWFINALKQHKEFRTLDILNVLYVLLKNKCYNSDICNELVGKYGLLYEIIGDENNVKLGLVALKCLQSISHYHENPQTKEKFTPLTNDLEEYCINFIIEHLYKKKHKDQSEINYCESILCIHKILIQIYSNNDDINKDLEKIIGACRYWMLYSLKSNTFEAPQKVTPSQQTIAEIPLPKKGGKRMKLRRHRKPKTISNDCDDGTDDFINNDKKTSGYTAANSFLDSNKKSTNNQYTVTSESDVSDSENAKTININSIQSKLRLTALNLLSIIIKSAEKHVIFGYWWALLPDMKINDECEIGGLAISMFEEPNAAGRSAAFTALLSMLTASRSYLLQADTSKHITLSFTPFSVALGICLENLHNLLSLQLERETCVPVLVTILKCTAACVQATPYHKLGGKILLPLMTNVRQLLTHNDWTVQVAALIVMGCIVSINPSPETVLTYLRDGLDDLPILFSKSNLMSKENVFSDDDNYSDDETSLSVQSDENVLNDIDSDENAMNWLLKVCLKNLGWSTDGIQDCNKSIVPIRLESLQVLTAMALQYFDASIAPFVEVLTYVLLSALDDISTEICLHASKCVGAIGDAMQKSEYLKIKSMFNNYVNYWTKMLSGSLTKLVQSDHHNSARVAACDSLATIGEKIFVKIEGRLQILITTLLLGCSGDEDPLIRAAAVRALSVCIMYQQWREDPSLVGDCIETVLRISSEPILVVRIKVTWALANITDALILNKNNPETESIDSNVFCQLLEAGIAASNENDKMKMNAMRVIGNMLVLIDDTNIISNSNLSNVALNAIARLEHCALKGNNMKVRWNACYALGKILKNPTIYNIGKWQKSVLESLCEIIGTCRNLKVCTHAATALCSPTNRSHYGTTFITVWQSVLQALNSIYHTEDFTEYRHKNNLIDQLCVTLSHLACLTVTDDLTEVLNPLCFYWEIAAKLLQEVIQRTEPQSDICIKLLNAAKYVTTELNSATEKQAQSLNILQNMFVWDCCT